MRENKISCTIETRKIKNPDRKITEPWRPFKIERIIETVPMRRRRIVKIWKTGKLHVNNRVSENRTTEEKTAQMTTVVRTNFGDISSGKSARIYKTKKGHNHKKKGKSVSREPHTPRLEKT
jgi:hypothetical protein